MRRWQAAALATEELRNERQEIIDERCLAAVRKALWPECCGACEGPCPFEEGPQR
jgi:hypothetical protein